MKTQEIVSTKLSQKKFSYNRRKWFQLIWRFIAIQILLVKISFKILANSWSRQVIIIYCCSVTYINKIFCNLIKSLGAAGTAVTNDFRGSSISWRCGDWMANSFALSYRGKPAVQKIYFVLPLPAPRTNIFVKLMLNFLEGLQKQLSFFNYHIDNRISSEQSLKLLQNCLSLNAAIQVP